MEPNRPVSLVILPLPLVYSLRCRSSRGNQYTSKSTPFHMHLDMAPDGPYLNRQLQETRAEVHRLEETLRAEREGHKSPSSSLHRSSGLVNDLFDSRGFDVTLKAFRWHLSYSTPGFAASIQTDPTFDLEELFDQVADSFDLQFRTKPARVVLPKWPPRRLIESSLEYFLSNRLY